MNASLLKNKNALTILLCVIAAVLIYSIDIFPLAYNLTPWKQFGDLPIQPARLVYLLADTPNVISYREPGASETVTCAEAVVYLETTDGDSTRCCQTETKISCLPGDYETDIPPADEACVRTLRETFGVPETLQTFAECPEGGNPQMIVVNMDADSRISWKTLTLFELDTLRIALRCAIAPILLGLAIRALVILLRKPDPSRQIRRW